MFSRRSLLIAVVIIALAASLPGVAGDVADTPPYEFDPADLEITLQRRSCYGMCPTYDVVIRGDGHGVFTGHKFVKELGERVFEVKPEDVIALLQQFYDVGFFDLREVYESRPNPRLTPEGRVQTLTMRVENGQPPILGIRVCDYSKSVILGVGSPPGTRELAAAVDTLAVSSRFVGEKSERH